MQSCMFRYTLGIYKERKWMKKAGRRETRGIEGWGIRWKRKR